MSEQTNNASEFNLEHALGAISARVSEKDVADYHALQEKMHAAHSSRIDPNSAESRIAKAKEQEHAINEQIIFLIQQPESELKDKRVIQALSRLAELLAEQGRYGEAIEVCPNREQRDSYNRIKRAIDLDDSEVCHCQGMRLTDPQTNREFTVSPDLVMQNVYSEKHDVILPLTLCLTCGLMQVR